MNKPFWLHLVAFAFSTFFFLVCSAGSIAFWMWLIRQGHSSRFDIIGGFLCGAVSIVSVVVIARMMKRLSNSSGYRALARAEHPTADIATSFIIGGMAFGDALYSEPKWGNLIPFFLGCAFTFVGLKKLKIELNRKSNATGWTSGEKPS